MSEDIGLAVTVTLPNRYFRTDLYVTVPGDTADPEDAARKLVARTLGQLAAYFPEVNLTITSIRRVG